MSHRFVLTPSASRDIDEILEYILEHSSPEMANHVHQRLLKGFRRIASRPNLVGHVRDDLADEDVRVYAVFSLPCYLQAGNEARRDHPRHSWRARLAASIRK